MKTVRLIDKENNSYVFDVPSDVNINSVDDILLGASDGICKLLAYKLSSEGKYKDVLSQPITDMSVMTKYNFAKRINIFADESIKLTQEDFGKMMVDVLAKAKDTYQRINKPRVTEFEGHKILQDSRGYYIKREVPCAAEGHTDMIKGTQRLSRDSDGNISRAQQLIPDDKRCQRARAGSRLWLCPDAAVKTIAVPAANKDAEVKENIAETNEVALQTEKKVSEGGSEGKSVQGNFGGQDLLLNELLNMTAADSNISAETIKGFARCVALVMTGGVKEGVR